MHIQLLNKNEPKIFNKRIWRKLSILVLQAWLAQRLKRLPGMRETRVRSLGQEDSLEKEMATHSSTLAWRIPWREEPDGLQSMGSQRVGHDWAASLSLSLWFLYLWASLVAQRLKHLPAMWETWVQSLGWEDPLEKERATHSSILAWRTPWREEPNGLQSMGSQIVGHDWVNSLHFTRLVITFFPRSKHL